MGSSRIEARRVKCNRTESSLVPEKTSGQQLSTEDVLRLSADIVASYVANNSIGSAGVPDLLRSVHRALSTLGEDAIQAPTPAEKPKPAAPISRSVQHEYIICLEDGKRLTMLKRYLRSRYNMSPEEYRRRWNLPLDYPMVAPAYANRRSEFAKSIGLGKTGRRKNG